MLVGAVETRLGIGRTASTMAVPLVTLTCAVLLPVLGALLVKRSLRWTAVTGAAFTVAGFLMLAFVPTYVAYLMAFALLLGPGQAIAVIAPATLVTRWFQSGQGRAMGLVCSPVIIAVIPLLTSATLQRFGVSATYVMLALLATVPLSASLFIRDRPPSSSDPAFQKMTGVERRPTGLTMRAILRLPVFWCLLGAFVPQIVGAIVLSAHMVPLAESWGLSAGAAVTLFSIQSFAGIAGTMLFGGLADRLGGTRTIALMAFGSALLWSCLLLSPSFTPAVLIVGFIGMCAAGVTPVTNHAIAEVFGQDSFSRSYGLMNLFILPFSVAGAPVAAILYTRGGSYAAVILAQIGFLVSAVPFALVALSLRRPTTPVEL